MRQKALLLSDIRFQARYGFYFIYFIFTILYIALIYAFPASWRKTAGILMIFTDPAGMGLYFMGAIVLFEKGERVLNSVAVSPVKPLEYVCAKLCSLAIISTVVAAAIGFGAGIVENAALFISGVFLCACLFSAIGLILATRISTLNGFILASIPPQLLINIPAIAWLFGWRKGWLAIHPGVAMMELCGGGSHGAAALCVLAAWTVLFTALAEAYVKKMFRKVGGAEL